jgi:hypothetical protein
VLKEAILNNVMKAAKVQEFSPKLHIYDLRDQNTSDDGVVIIGGLVGELIMTFTCLLDFILASPSNQNFFFSQEAIEDFLLELLGTEES